MNRLSKDKYYFDIAIAVAKRGTCLRRNYGAVIVNNDQIVGTGYTGAPRGLANCIDRGVCLRNDMQIPAGERYELCRSVHAEMNAIISAGRERCISSSLYVMGIDRKTGVIIGGEPCLLCKKIILNAGIKWVMVAGEVENGDIKTYEMVMPSVQRHI